MKKSQDHLLELNCWCVVPKHSSKLTLKIRLHVIFLSPDEAMCAKCFPCLTLCVHFLIEWIIAICTKSFVDTIPHASIYTNYFVGIQNISILFSAKCFHVIWIRIFSINKPFARLDNVISYDDKICCCFIIVTYLPCLMTQLYNLFFSYKSFPIQFVYVGIYVRSQLINLTCL